MESYKSQSYIRGHGRQRMKTAEGYREEARRVRELALEMPAAAIQAALREVAASYEGLAHSAETLAELDDALESSGHDR